MRFLFVKSESFNDGKGCRSFRRAMRSIHSFTGALRRSNVSSIVPVTSFFRRTPPAILLRSWSVSKSARRWVPQRPPRWSSICFAMWPGSDSSAWIPNTLSDPITASSIVRSATYWLQFLCCWLKIQPSVPAVTRLPGIASRGQARSNILNGSTVAILSAPILEILTAFTQRWL